MSYDLFEYNVPINYREFLAALLRKPEILNDEDREFVIARNGLEEYLGGTKIHQMFIDGETYQARQFLLELLLSSENLMEKQTSDHFYVSYLELKRDNKITVLVRLYQPEEEYKEAEHYNLTEHFQKYGWDFFRSVPDNPFNFPVLMAENLIPAKIFVNENPKHITLDEDEKLGYYIDDEGYLRLPASDVYDVLYNKHPDFETVATETTYKETETNAHHFWGEECLNRIIKLKSTGQLFTLKQKTHDYFEWGYMEAFAIDPRGKQITTIIEGDITESFDEEVDEVENKLPHTFIIGYPTEEATETKTIYKITNKTGSIEEENVENLKQKLLDQLKNN